MTYRYGRASQAELATVHHELNIIFADVIEVFDVSIIQGARTVEEQIRNIRRGVSKTIDSRHIPRDSDGRYDPRGRAIAVDAVPYQEGVNPWPLDSDDPVTREKKKARFYYMQGIIRDVAHRHGIEIRQGVDWDRDNDIFDQTFDDLPHVELWRPDWPDLVLEGELLELANEALRSKGLREAA